MFYLRRKGWEIAEREATDESVFLNRRSVLKSAGYMGLAAAGLVGHSQAAPADPSSALYPAPRNNLYKLDRDLTAETIASHYNNFYEYGLTKSIAAAAEQLRLRPWTVAIDGLVEAPRQMDIDQLLKLMPLEERLYRHRCVEAWSMSVPWTGFPLRALVALAKPLSSATYVRFETFNDPDMAPEQRGFWPWPYVEGLTIAEASHDLAFMVTGAYGKPLAKAFGAPLRVHLPWKYGFKSAKSLVRMSFTDKRPETFWETSGPGEYGFWANVNPDVPHPRWSQASEEVLGTHNRRPTLIYNGYGEYVADLYKDMAGEKLFM
jgi:sulfoxide reductase catalytic subunit YedY